MVEKLGFANCFPLTTHIFVLQMGKQGLDFDRGWAWWKRWVSNLIQIDSNLRE